VSGRNGDQLIRTRVKSTRHCVIVQRPRRRGDIIIARLNGLNCVHRLSSCSRPPRGAHSSWPHDCYTGQHSSKVGERCGPSIVPRGLLQPWSEALDAIGRGGDIGHRSGAGFDERNATVSEPSAARRSSVNAIALKFGCSTATAKASSSVRSTAATRCRRRGRPRLGVHAFRGSNGLIGRSISACLLVAPSRRFASPPRGSDA
jgi:hypothetical protein